MFKNVKAVMDGSNTDTANVLKTTVRSAFHPPLPHTNG